ncbi:hypothetical protein [Accumulibacter sp.]|uniref:hypothetical protein n=1 Tax=Accumulibacter sp. TaxID=2053492 RepID=UPI0028C4B741|nr:hypothetical protein [Accumulibacter sp.]
MAQLASLPDALRQRLIAASGVGAYERQDDINALVYFAAPNRFGAMCDVLSTLSPSGER